MLGFFSYSAYLKLAFDEIQYKCDPFLATVIRLLMVVWQYRLFWRNDGQRFQVYHGKRYNFGQHISLHQKHFYLQVQPSHNAIVFNQ